MGSCDSSIDDVADELAILSQLIIFYSRIGIELEISIERARHKFALSYSELVEYVKNVVSFKDQYLDWCPNYFDTEEVMELMHIIHFESAR